MKKQLIFIHSLLMINNQLQPASSRPSSHIQTLQRPKNVLSVKTSENRTFSSFQGEFVWNQSPSPPRTSKVKESLTDELLRVPRPRPLHAKHESHCHVGRRRLAPAGDSSHPAAPPRSRGSHLHVHEGGARKKVSHLRRKWDQDIRITQSFFMLFQ